MRVVIQRVNKAYVEIGGSKYSEIKKGLCIFLGVENDAKFQDIPWLVNKIINLRIFNDDQGKMNRSVIDVDGDLLVVSQFTLHASTRKGNRPSFIQAAKPDFAETIYKIFINQLEQMNGRPVQTGVFGGDMKVGLENDGPVTILIDTETKW